ncbi:MAG: glycosyltransferase [Acidobacteriota bacterium]
MRSPFPSSPLPLTFGFLDFAAGGAQQLILTACRHLDRTRFEPHLLCLRGGGRWTARAQQQGLAVSELHRLERPWDFPAVGRAQRHLAARGTGILHTPLYSRASPYLRLAARRARVPLIVAHEFGRPEGTPWKRRWADAWLASGTRFLATSEFHRHELLARGVPAGVVDVVYSGIDLEPYDAAPTSGLRRQLSIGHRPLILVPARLHPMKGHRDLLAAYALLRHAVPGATLVLAGEGPAEEALRQEVEERGLTGEVFLLGHREDMPALLAAADIVCLPSHREGLPAALLEAFAAGKPVVATDVGGVPEALTDGAEGHLVPPKDPAALGRALVHLLRHEETRRAMGAAGRRTVEQRFQAADTTRALEDCYLRWLAEGTEHGAA